MKPARHEESRWQRDILDTRVLPHMPRRRALARSSHDTAYEVPWKRLSQNDASASACLVPPSSADHRARPRGREDSVYSSSIRCDATDCDGSPPQRQARTRRMPQIAAMTIRRLTSSRRHGGWIHPGISGLIFALMGSDSQRGTVSDRQVLGSAAKDLHSPSAPPRPAGTRGSGRRAS